MKLGSARFSARRIFTSHEQDVSTATDTQAWKWLSIADASSLTKCEQGSTELLEYFPTPRDAVEYIMETFPIVKRKDEAEYGEYRTKLQILDIYARMQQAIDTGKPYQTLLDPPPGPPADEHGTFLPLPEWKPGHPKPSNLAPPHPPTQGGHRIRCYVG